MKQENSLFKLAFRERLAINGEDIMIIEASKEYVQQSVYEMPLETTHEGGFILIPERLSHLEQQISQATAMYSNPFGQAHTVILPQISIATISPWQYFTDGLYVYNTVVVVNDDVGVILGGESYFTYYGTKDEAQAYYDLISLQFDTPPVSRIGSVKELFFTSKAFFTSGLLLVMPAFLLTLLAVGSNLYHVATLNCLIHGKKSAVLMSEGRRTFDLILSDIKICAILLLVAQAALVWVMGMRVMEVVYVIGTYFVLDVALLLGVTHHKMKNFAERLR